MASTATRQATDKQKALLTRLAAERDTTTLAQSAQDTLAIVLDGRGIPASWASRLIELLFAAPRSISAPQAQPGYYVQGDDVLVVVANREGTRTYAKRLVIEQGENRKHAAWVYAPGVGATLAGYEPLTVEEAARLGHMHGICVLCCKPLTDPESVTRGVGPVCARRLAA